MPEDTEATPAVKAPMAQAAARGGTISDTVGEKAKPIAKPHFTLNPVLSAANEDFVETGGAQNASFATFKDACGRDAHTARRETRSMEDVISDPERAKLDAELLRAHAEGAADRLISLYADAGETALARGQIEAGSFYLTHARVFALESGDPREAALHARLIALGRDS